MQSYVVAGDRLSGLTDDLIHKIFSFVSIRDAIRTSVLSPRWRFIWTSTPYLNFANEHGAFVNEVLSRLNIQLQLYSVKLINKSRVTQDFVKIVINCAVSHNVQQLTVTCFLDKPDFPLSVFSSKSLKHLTFNGGSSPSYLTVSPTWELPALTTLHLEQITLPDNGNDDEHGLFSKCTNLKNLSLSRCKMNGRNSTDSVFNIFHPQLLNLTLVDTKWNVEVFNVVTPQLKNLTIRYCYGKHQISAPGLTSLVFRGDHPLMELSTEGFPFLNKVDLFIGQPVADKIVSLLQKLHTLKFLTINLEILKLLCSSTQPCLFPNFKIVNFSPRCTGIVHLETTELKNHDTPPSTIFTMVSCEDIEVMKKMVSTKVLIETLRWQLKRCEGNRDHMTSRKRKRAKVKVKKQWVKSEFEMQWHFGEMMTQIEQGKVDGLLTKQLPTKGMCLMISNLECISGLVTELPTSKMTPLQATFSRICEEAALLMNNMMDGMKNPPVILRSSRARTPKLNQDSSFIYE